MPRRPAKRRPAPKPRQRRPEISTAKRRAAHPLQRWLHLVRSAPVTLQLTLLLAACALLWAGLNWSYQVVRKPSELFFPVSGSLYKTPTATWKRYRSLFHRHSTSMVTPELLAALAQVEGSGNPVVRTYWRWSFSAQPFDVYRPASSAVGMYQMTNGTFAEARRYCIHDHAVVEDGPWHAWRSCWFTSWYTRVIPSHAVELTSAYLDRRMHGILARSVSRPSVAQQHDLAAMIHLCGAGAGARYAARGFRLLPGQRCGDHDVRGYLTRVSAMRRTFAALAARD
jgi:hypothetical protein